MTNPSNKPPSPPAAGDDPVLAELARAGAAAPAGAGSGASAGAGSGASAGAGAGASAGAGGAGREEASDEEATLVRLDPEEAMVEESSGTYRAVKIPKEFGRFQLLMEMGQGGMATLYLARIQGPEKFEKLVAIKKIHDHLTRERRFIEMFLDEARIAALIHHPNVATIFDLGKIEEAYFIAMEYIHGQNLNDVLSTCIRRRIRFPWTLAVRIVADAAAGLHAAHELLSPEGRPLNVVHRDVSPQNILMSYDGHVKVVDFGIAFAAEKVFHTAAGTLKGKAAYMSPEQTRGEKPDRRSDIFALGIVLFESLCMQRLFREETEASTLLKVREAVVPRPRSIRPEIPARLEPVILKALARDRENRFATAGELGEALEEVLVSEGEVVSHLKSAKMMDRLFYEKKKFKDKQIQEALHDQSPQAIKGVAMEGTTNTSLQAPGSSSMEMAQPRRALATALTAAGLFAAAAVILAVVLIIRRPGSSASEKPSDAEKRAAKQETKQETTAKQDPDPRKTGPGAMKARPEKPLPSTVTFTVIVKPNKAKATVTFRGKRHRGGVFTTKVKRSTTPETVEVTAPGYLDQMLMLVPTQDSKMTVNLKPDRSRRRTRRRPSKRKRRRLLKDLPF